MAIATFTVKIEDIKLKVTAIIAVFEEKPVISITSIRLKKNDIIDLLSDNALKKVEKEIKKQIC